LSYPRDNPWQVLTGPRCPDTGRRTRWPHPRRRASEVRASRASHGSVRCRDAASRAWPEGGSGSALPGRRRPTWAARMSCGQGRYTQCSPA